MKNLVLSVLASVALSAGITHEIVKSAPAVAEAREITRFNELRQATWRIDIMSQEGQPVGSCSGTAIAPDVILTAGHCDASQMGYKTMVNGLSANVMKVDRSKDLMLLSVPGLNSPVVKFEDLVLGQDHKVVVVGYPFGLSQYITEGKVQGVLNTESLVANGVTEHYFGVSAQVSPGNSGGGVYAKNKEGVYVLIGVVSRGGGTVSLIVHPDEIAKFLNGV